MLKTMMLGAFVAVSVCALAQDGWRDDDRSAIDSNGKSRYEIAREVCKMDQYLSGSGSYDFEMMLNRMRGNTEDALISGLFSAHRQAVLVRDQIVASKCPAADDTMIVIVPGADHTAVLAEETEGSMRPMRMVMQGSRPMDIDYDTAWEIVTANLNDTQTTQLARWWDNPENDHGKDLVCELLKIDARRADDPVYVSLYTHHMYPIIPIN